MSSTDANATVTTGWCCEHHTVDRATHLAEAVDWWRSEWEHKNREAEGLWRACFVLGILCGVFFFVGTLLG